LRDILIVSFFPSNFMEIKLQYNVVLRGRILYFRFLVFVGNYFLQVYRGDFICLVELIVITEFLIIYQVYIIKMVH